jgi:hypothetical protein
VERYFFRLKTPDGRLFFAMKDSVTPGESWIFRAWAAALNAVVANVLCTQ